MRQVEVMMWRDIGADRVPGAVLDLRTLGRATPHTFLYCTILHYAILH